MEKFEKVQKASNFDLVLFVIFVKFFLGTESSIMKLATSPCLKIFVSLSLSRSVISFDNRLEAVRLSSQG